MNVQLLREVQKAVLTEPAQFIMGYCFTDAEMGFIITDVPRKIPNCGAAACLAGWTVAIHEQITPADLARLPVLTRAERYLQLSPDEADELFHVIEWPARFREAWWATRDLNDRARIASDVINDFIMRHNP